MLARFAQCKEARIRKRERPTMRCRWRRRVAASQLSQRSRWSRASAEAAQPKAPRMPCSETIR